MDRVSGWAELLDKFGDLEADLKPALFIHQRCARLLATLPSLQHDPNRPEDVLKVDADEAGVGGDDAAAAKPITFLGALSYWWFGEHGTPRMDTSEHVYYANDQLAVRFIEEIDFDYVASDAAAALKTAAS